MTCVELAADDPDVARGFCPGVRRVTFADPVGTVLGVPQPD